MKKEYWKDIDGYEGIYQVSNLGRVRSLNRYIDNRGTQQLIKGKIYIGNNNGNGYLYINLCKSGKITRKATHRLVAEAFIDNPNNLPQVNHKDENKQNNCVDNLEWCDAKFNANYGTRNKRMKNNIIKKYSKKVIQYDLDGNFIREFNSIEDTAKHFNVTSQSINRCCKGKLKRCKNYIFKFKSEVM